MRFSEAWLRSCVNPDIATAELAAQLTMAGLEVDSIEPVAAPFSGVVVGEVLELSPHPNADRLRVCRVDAGRGEPLTIVCGAPNVALGMKAPLAVEGAVLPGGMTIRSSELRGVRSFGMLCSGKELGFEDGQGGLLALPADAPVGADLRDYLQLDDVAIEVDLTPNRADCLSVHGIAREVALLNGLAWQSPEAAPVAEGMAEVFPVDVAAPEACPRYLGRLLRGLRAGAPTPNWMVERLRRSGLRSLGPLVDVTNYVLLEMGQPLHAFDAARLTGSVRVRWARAGETLALLNDQTIELQDDMLVIADDAKPLALAGVMGGRDSAVGDDTSAVFLECAYFAPVAVAGRARRFGLATDSSHRFERGVDPTLQYRAIARATELLLEIAGGVAGPVVEVCAAEHLPVRAPVRLRAERVTGYLGLAIPAGRISAILESLGMAVEPDASGWMVTPPGYRFDIALEVDLIEEIGRVYGYDNLPKCSPLSAMRLQTEPETRVDLDRLKDILVDRGYQEAITYSFVDATIQAKLEPAHESLALLNPISAELAVMRTGLWCGLVGAALKNLNRQQQRVRLFESGLRFRREQGEIRQEKSLAGLVLGPVEEEQWGARARLADFYDVKADLQALFRHCGIDERVAYAAASHPALHPGQSARLMLDGRHLGWLGMLHPRLESELGFDGRVFLFELDQAPLLQRSLAAFQGLSKFPQVRRDIAVVVVDRIACAELVACIRRSAGELLRDVVVFDRYQGENIGAGLKSVALGLILQDDADTLTDVRVDAVMQAVVAALANEFQAKLRD
jgi:phenylalanyl-tRNA synthetase beta chain